MQHDQQHDLQAATPLSFLTSGFNAAPTPIVDEERVNPLEVLLAPHPTLSLMSEDITEVGPEIKQLTADMLDKVDELGAYGLSAVQVGVPLKLFVVDPQRCGIDASNPRVFLNAYLTHGECPLKAEEGCLSIPGIAPTVERFYVATVMYQDIELRWWKLECGGTYARAIQHEIDHTLGKTVLRHATQGQRHAYNKLIKKMKK